MHVKSIRFSVRRPNKHRRTFSVVKDTLYSNNKREQTLLDDPRIDALNLNMQRGLLTVDAALAEVKGSIVPALKREANVKEKEKLESRISENNLNAYRAFWEYKYKGVDLKNEVATRNDFERALIALGPLSITTSSRSDIRDQYGTLTAEHQRRFSIRINQLLTFLGRGFTIDKVSREHQDVDFVTWDELQLILPHVYSDEVRALTLALFGTGVRIGEAFAPGFSRLKPNNTIYINKQLDRSHVVRDIKNNKPHHTYLLPECVEGYKAWCHVEDKAAFRDSATNQIIRASTLAFPKIKEKQVSAHDLRHSYAIHWLGKGASLSQIANLLGDSSGTVELHYAGFVLTDEMVTGMKELLE